MKRILLLVLFTVSIQALLFAQSSQVSIAGSQIRKITSSIVDGQEYELQILLPKGYAASTKKYPVIYVMDSQWDFPLVASIYGQQYYDGFLPELIIVGVTWGGINPNPDSLRARDYTPTPQANMIQSGGADKFLLFMKGELFPFIESTYKAQKDNRTITGCSLGGLITLYALFTQPEMFSNYIAASPAVGWDQQVLYKYLHEFNNKKTLQPKRVFMTVGDVERSKPIFEKFAAEMNTTKPAAISVISKALENTGHSGTKTETYSNGLKFSYKRPDLQISNDVLNKYTGTYVFPNGNNMEIKNENNKLVVYFSATNKTELLAETETDFYTTTEFLKLHYEKDNNNNEGFRIDRYGSSWFATKKR